MGASHRVANFTEPPEGDSIKVEVDALEITVFRAGGKLYAIDARCPHAGGPLDEGEVTGTSVQCPWHGSIFSLSTGAVEQGPAARPVPTYVARMDGTTLVLDEGPS